MWADHGGIDFHGRASWDAWTELKVRARAARGRMACRMASPCDSLTRTPVAQGMDADQATAKFCRVYAEAHTSERFATNFHGTASK